MKKLVYIAVAALALLSMSACNKVTTEGLTDITYYADIVLTDGNSVLWPIGQPWVDPGYTATVNGEDVTSAVKTSGTPDVNTPGAYTVNYYHTNVDGYSAGVKRTVYVCDPSVTLDLAGTYTVDVNATRGASGTYKQYADARKVASPDTYGPYVSTDIKVTFTKIAPGFFYCNDLFAGWYTYINGRGGYIVAANNNNANLFTYYDMTGYVLADNDGNISYVSGYIECWGDGLDDLVGKYDAATKTLSYDFSYADGVVVGHPVMTKK